MARRSVVGARSDRPRSDDRVAGGLRLAELSRESGRVTGTYTHGHHESVLRSHRWRTAENSAAYLVPYLEAGGSVLDVGCGPGTITIDLARRVAPGQVVGIDAVIEPLEMARSDAVAAHVDNVTFQVADAYALPFDEASFDVVHAHQVLQHLTDPVAALREMGRVCRPDGIVAARDSDYAAMAWHPGDPRLDRWRRIYDEVARANGGEPDAGRRLLVVGPGGGVHRRHGHGERVVLRHARGSLVVGRAVGGPGDALGVRPTGARQRSDRGRRAGGDRRRVAILGDPTRRLVHGAGRRGPVSPWPYPCGVTIYHLDDAADLVAPSLVAAFDGWVDAGSAATTALEQLVDGAPVVATFDADVVFDYRARRPPLEIVDGRLTELTWPELTLRRVRAGDHDLLVLVGPEPDYRWRELVGAAIELTRRLGVVEWISLGAIPAAVPHTRPVPILGTESAPGLLRSEVPAGPDGILRVPSALVSALELEVSRSGVPALGYFAQVPHYISGAYPAASIALLEALGRHLGVSLPMGDLSDEAVQLRTRLDTATAIEETTRTYVERLEGMVDEQRLPAGDDLIADIERFLREGA